MSDDKTTAMKLSDYPLTQWQPHKPATWPWRIGKLRQPTRLRIWNGHGADPEFTERWLPAGAYVKIVMVSRFGDVGITDDLDAEHSYHSRIDLEMLEPVNV
jgi:hypothetical protein